MAYLERIQKRSYMDKYALTDKPAPPPYSSPASSSRSQAESVRKVHPTMRPSPTVTPVPPPEYTRAIQDLQTQLMRTCLGDNQSNYDMDFDGKKEDRVFKKLFSRRFFGMGKEKKATVVDDSQIDSTKSTFATKQTALVSPTRPRTNTG